MSYNVAVCNRLLYSTLWIRGRDSGPPASSAPIHAQLPIYKYHALASFRIAPPFPPYPARLQAPRGPTVVGGDSWGINEDHRCRLPLPAAQAATKMQQPTSNPAPRRKEGLRQATRGRGKLVVRRLVIGCPRPKLKSSLHKPCQLPACERKKIACQCQREKEHWKFLYYQKKWYLETSSARVFNDVLRRSS